MAGIIILAAGESKRLGQPKQNLIFRGETLLQNTIDAALNSNCSPVIVVTGAHADSIAIPPHENLSVLYNPDWPEGMASSIRLAINELVRRAIPKTIMLLCDQPFVDAPLINTMLGKQKATSKTIVACSYADTIGVPVLFDAALYPALLQLKGHEGAKKILAANSGEIATVVFEKGWVDIDTIGDYEGLVG